MHKIVRNKEFEEEVRSLDRLLFWLIQPASGFLYIETGRTVAIYTI
jgi:hypothetical protein